MLFLISLFISVGSFVKYYRLFFRLSFSKLYSFLNPQEHRCFMCNDKFLPRQIFRPLRRIHAQTELETFSHCSSLGGNTNSISRFVI